MAKPRLSEFMLLLATDAAELGRYNDATETDRRAMLRAAGLTEAQYQAVMSGDPDRISKEILTELKKDAGERAIASVHYTIQLEIDLKPPRHT